MTETYSILVLGQEAGKVRNVKECTDLEVLKASLAQLRAANPSNTYYATKNQGFYHVRLNL